MVSYRFGRERKRATGPTVVFYFLFFILARWIQIGGGGVFFLFLFLFWDLSVREVERERKGYQEEED